ncbi:hypothetical protein GE061_005378 [Apolygus lucorum]|uniref:DUF4745 domain-containing protein n=1 Tax=Apolygus lucorum TaxID=248454 RepID=A0A8S9WXW3_APOLU|nr:hypothetical protein GE061_005378 [Apolygus lucorum]
MFSYQEFVSKLFPASDMKKVSPGGAGRGKPPSARLHSKARGPHYPQPAYSERLLSMSEAQEMVELSRFSSKEVSDCMAQWLSFLKVMRMLCSTGSELTDSLSTLNCGSTACKSRLDQCKAMWDHLRLATNSASAIATNQTFASLQEAHVAPDIDQDQAEINQGVVCSGLLRLLNLQYQFSAACCEWVSSMPGCSCLPPHTSREVEAIARCFPLAVGSTTVSVPQRRWSEAAAAGHEKVPPDPTLRRWSIPWKLALPSAEKSRSTTPDAVWHNALASQEDLQDAISLLSIKPSNSNLPGVVLTKAADSTVDSNKPIRSSWWGDPTECDMSGDHLNSTASLASRKSSSSTDTTTSSCYSLHRSTTTSSEELSRPGHLYSMWSGAELPFIKLPESTAEQHPDTG